jgi:hypothetical protein
MGPEISGSQRSLMLVKHADPRECLPWASGSMRFIAGPMLMSNMSSLALRRSRLCQPDGISGVLVLLLTAVAQIE